MESESDDNPSNILEIKKMELGEIRSERMKGQLVQACSEWNIEGEKASRNFCSLETKNYLSKTIKHLKKPNGNYLTSQNEILDSISHYYKTLFKANDQNIQGYHLSDILGQYSIIKLNTTEAIALEGAIMKNELWNALKHMKHNKTPGIDGFPSEFYKIFWKYLKSCFLKALNDSMDRGKLPLSLHQCVITCL